MLGSNEHFERNQILSMDSIFTEILSGIKNWVQKIAVVHFIGVGQVAKKFF